MANPAGEAPSHPAAQESGSREAEVGRPSPPRGQGHSPARQGAPQVRVETAMPLVRLGAGRHAPVAVGGADNFSIRVVAMALFFITIEKRQ